MMSNVAAIALVLILAAGICANAVHRWRATAPFQGRPHLSKQEIFDLFYAKTGLPFGTVMALWCEVAATLGVPLGQLRPGDRFCKEVGGFLIISDRLDTLGELAEKRNQGFKGSVKLERLQTVDDYVRAFARAAQ